MDDVGDLTVTRFAAPEELLSDIDARSAAALISAVADVALVIDGQGVIRDMAIGNQDITFDGSGDWVGRHWLETVTVESRPKVLAMLRDAATKTVPERPWRQVNHPMNDGAGVPVLYSAIRVGDQGRVVAIGRDLRNVATLQQRLVDAQQALERDYMRLRQTEARYRLLFDTIGEAVLVVDAVTLGVVEANPAAQRLFGDGTRRLIGRPALDSFDNASRDAVASLLAAARSAGRADDAVVRLPGGSVDVTLAASLFKHDGGSLLLLRLTPPRDAAGNGERSRTDATLLRVIDKLPDAFVVTDPQGRILAANTAFGELAQLPAGEQVTGQSLDRWLGRSAVDLNVMLGTLRQHGVVRLFPTTLRAGYGAPAQVEISAVSVTQGELPCLGFTIRDVERRLSADMRSRDVPRSPGQLAELVGRMPLKDIVGETTDLIERMCIEAALALTRDNRASAAEMLGLSRQSLYVKLRRYGMGDLAANESEQPS